MAKRPKRNVVSPGVDTTFFCVLERANDLSGTKVIAE